MYCLQKASMWKRISAALFDVIILAVVAVGIAFLLSSMLGYSTYYDRLDACYEKYETEYGVDFDISSSDYNALSEAERAQFDAAAEAFENDEEVPYLWTMLFNLALVILTFAILIAFLLLELLVPLLFKNGQSLGKKIFGIALMREDGVKVTPLLIFVRSMLGKYTLETMLPVLLLVMMYFGATGIVGAAVIIVIAITQIITFLFTRARTPIHDKLAHTVCVDFTTQMIFESPEALLEYQKKLQREQAEIAPY